MPKAAVFALLTAFAGQLFSEPLLNPKERISFWRENYSVYKQDDPAVANIFHIFEVIKKVAGIRPGKNPRLVVIKETPYGFNLPISLPDGGIILSKGMLDRLRADHGDYASKIAFIFGHEIAHVFSGDFWHIEFFRLISHYDGKSHINITPFLDDKRELTKKELAADEQGLLYMLMAGYDPSVIWENKRYQNFFDEWNRRISLIQGTNFKPLVPEFEREKAVKFRLKQIIDQSVEYRAGIYYFLAGHYQSAIELFEDFSHVFPGREVYHNLAMSHHFAAIACHTPVKFVKKSAPMKFSYIIDPVERLFIRARRNGVKSNPQCYAQHMAKAVQRYKLALLNDPDYLPAIVNLASAHMGQGNIYKAIGLLMDKRPGADALLLNNLAIAHELIGDLDKAADYYRQAIHQQNPDALYNLGRMYYWNGQIKKAESYWHQYLQHDRQSHFAHVVEDLLEIPREAQGNHSGMPQTAGILKVNMRVSDIPSDWKIRFQRRLPLSGRKARFVQFSNGTEAVLENDRVKIIHVSKPVPTSTALKLALGDNEDTIRENYGFPSKTLFTPNGKILSFQDKGIAFVLQENKLQSWVLHL